KAAAKEAQDKIAFLVELGAAAKRCLIERFCSWLICWSCRFELHELAEQCQRFGSDESAPNCEKTKVTAAVSSQESDDHMLEIVHRYACELLLVEPDELLFPDEVSASWTFTALRSFNKPEFTALILINKNEPHYLDASWTVRLVPCFKRCICRTSIHRHGM